jgi:hypothetical protein
MACSKCDDRRYTTQLLWHAAAGLLFPLEN